MRGEVSLLIHATEDKDRVIASTKEVLDISASESSFTIRNLEGHFRNPLSYVKVKLGREKILDVLENVLKKLDDSSLEYLKGDLEEFLDEKGRLHLHLNKQELCLGRCRLTTSGGIKIVAKIGKERLLEMLKHI